MKNIIPVLKMLQIHIPTLGYEMGHMANGLLYLLQEFNPTKTRTSSSKGPKTSLPMMVGFEEETSPC
jgi:hypothetical protein